jgi:hypothetical protein
MCMYVCVRMCVYVCTGYLENVHKNDDLLIVTHIPEVPKLPSFSWKSNYIRP